MLRLSFGSGNVKNGSTVNRDAMLTPPSIMVAREILPAGYYAVTMVRTDVPYLHWIKVNMPSTMKQGKDVVVYQPPSTDALLPSIGPMTFLVTIWRQARGRLSPIPKSPVNLARFDPVKFAKKNGLVEFATVGVIAS